MDVPLTSHDDELMALAMFVVARLSDRITAGEAPAEAKDHVAERTDTVTQRDLVEWAPGIEELRALGDVAAPPRPLGREVLQIVAER